MLGSKVQIRSASSVDVGTDDDDAVGCENCGELTLFAVEKFDFVFSECKSVFTCGCVKVDLQIPQHTNKHTISHVSLCTHPFH